MRLDFVFYGAILPAAHEPLYVVTRFLSLFTLFFLRVLYLSRFISRTLPFPVSRMRFWCRHQLADRLSVHLWLVVILVVHPQQVAHARHRR